MGTIPFNQPVHLGTELSAMGEAILRHGHVAGGGPFNRKCEAWLEQRYGCRALVVTSATHALEMAALLLDIKEGDEVIVPSYTFVSTANAFVLRGAQIVFADCDEGGNILPEEVERLRTARTRAVVPVHYAGNSCDMDALKAAAGSVPLVEDAAQAITARYRGTLLGTLGACGVLSFHETKNVGCGEGGALLIRDPALAERAEYLRDKGTNRRRFQLGLVDKYTWVDVGSSYVLSDLNAAYLSTQLTEIERIQARRAEIFSAYDRALTPCVQRLGGYAIATPAHNSGNQHLFALVLRDAGQRERFIHYLRERQIMAPFHYVPLHQSPFGSKFHASGRALPNSERLGSCLVRLPLFFNQTDAQVERVIEVATEALGVV